MSRVADRSRRSLLQMAAASAAAAMLPYPAKSQAKTWNGGDVAHLIPTASHERFLIKASFQNARSEAPVLRVDGQATTGSKTDLAGKFWQFDAQDLEAGKEYTLQLFEGGGGEITETWPLKTFPAPGTTPPKMRILAFTCAGGMDGPILDDGKTGFLDMAARHRLLERGIAFEPDVVISNGDHIYWDIKTSMNKPYADFMRKQYWDPIGGELDTNRPMLDPRNADIFQALCDHQIAGLYGTRLRSSPSFFVTDDHDMFENDEFTENLATQPADSYGLRAAELTQFMYYPELLPYGQPYENWLDGGLRAGRASGSNMLYGSIRYGDLMETVIYDCRRMIDYKGKHARILPQAAENWIIDRTLSEDTLHFMHCPSMPFGYSSGKLGDWYPDNLDEKTGKLVMYNPKAGWQSGWYGQHQRLLEALSLQQKRAPVIMQGDFHASGAGQIYQSGELSFSRPIETVLTGALGTGDTGFPSSMRSVETMPSQLIGMEQLMETSEKNGFTVIDVTEDSITYSMYTWRPPEPLDNIDTMEPILVRTVPRNV
ncbi:hypothetical protein GP644_09565 [Parasedimentitalea maritima]|uniref:PhoD-like phosphatase metallophosphatase domain-containing protein n=1 Tax=Parasedimentitalea maritima TaxID=2578117 RepID=A0A6A4RFB2_9RHOB|nr:hypothetical protein GP644_09565 [Zongyanglinia marina]